MPSGSDPPAVELRSLVHLFYERPADLATFRWVAGHTLPEPYRKLLDHSGHMTVTVESFYDQPVDVHVLRHETTLDRYQREIVLIGQVSKRVVQYGIVRLNPGVLRPEVWNEISARQIPLGRVLISHQVLREVELIALWEVQCGPALATALRCQTGDRTYGRTALIYCDGQPAIELLEIVAPV